jgi:hypothetical protein
LQNLALPLQKSGYGNYLMSILDDLPVTPREPEPAVLPDLELLGALGRHTHALSP